LPGPRAHSRNPRTDGSQSVASGLGAFSSASLVIGAIERDVIRPPVVTANGRSIAPCYPSGAVLGGELAVP